jgi:hypothetical protein
MTGVGAGRADPSFGTTPGATDSRKHNCVIIPCGVVIVPPLHPPDHQVVAMHHFGAAGKTENERNV